jgi:thioesterase domain-containing protein/acyl carrier protein
MLQPLSVDSSQTVIFPALVSGGCLHILSEERAADPQALSEYFSRFPIDLLKIAPSHLAALQSSSRPEQLLPRRWLIVGGEVSHWDWMNRLHALASCAIFNHYGPTEATVGMSTYRVEKDQNAHGSSTVPIGRPLPNTQAFLLDRRLQPVPIGVAGELHIGGSCLARGYLNHPELTAEKFISHPFSDEAGARLYKTGDLARYLPDGNIEFLGRLDNQIKIRGFRVEPGEIEAALVQHPAVREAVIVARENPSASLRTGTQLIAYVVPKQKASSHAPELRAFLRQKLPDPLVPAFFIPLDALPRTPHGKLDRHALPTPDQARAELDETPAEPRNPIENALARIWSQLLGLKRVGVHDSFFDLGGHSLLAVEMMQRVEQVCGEKLPLSMLLEGPTIKQLAAALFKQRVEENRSLLVKVQSGGSKQPFFYLHGDWQGGGFYCLELARSLGADQPFYALTPHGVQGAAAPTTVEAMAASYIQMVRAVQPEGPYFLGGICNGAVVAFEMARQLEQQGCRVNLVLLIGAHARTVLPRRLLHGVISRLGSWLGLSPEARSRLFLGIRDFGHRVRRLFRNSRHPLNAQFRPRLSERDQEIHEVLAGALGAYVPQPYGGRVAVLWPTDERFNRERDPTLGWGRVTSQLDMELIPGGHITCVTRHLDKLAARMKAHLERAQGNGASDTAARFR